MKGRYDSYGRVFFEGGEQELLVEAKPILTEEYASDSRKEEDNKSFTWQYDDWGNLVDLDLSKNDKDGIAAFHEKCWDGKDPTTNSVGDPNQGWGEDGEYFASTGVVEDQK